MRRNDLGSKTRNFKFASQAACHAGPLMPQTLVTRGNLGPRGYPLTSCRGLLGKLPRLSCRLPRPWHRRARSGPGGPKLKFASRTLVQEKRTP